MTITSKYFVQTPTGDNLNVLDVSLAYGRGSITTRGETIQYNGSDAVDAFWVRPGLSYDLQSTGNGLDKIYFTGSLNDYTLAASATDNTLTLTRTSTLESVVINGGSTGNFDYLVFNNGFVNSNALYKAAKNGTAVPALITSETSLAPVGAAAAGAVLNDTIKAFAINQNGETFASTKPGVKLIISGAAGIDQVYVADGTNVDATDTGSGNDLIFLRGKWSDYTKSTDVSGNTITFTRTIGGNTEIVKVTGGTTGSHDTVVFADGAAQTNDAFTTLKTNPNATTAQVGGLGFAASPVTPLISDPVIDASIATLQAAAHNDNATLPTALTETVYKNTDAKNVITANVGAYNSALDSGAIDSPQVASTADVQKIVDAFNAIIASADGNTTPNTVAGLTAAQFATVGVTAAPASGNALALLDNVVDVSAAAAVDTTAELQAMVNAAKDVAAATGQGMGTTVSQEDLAALGITGNISPTTIAAIEAAIGAATPGTLNTKAELQALVTAATNPTALNAALLVLQTAATGNTAAGLTAVDYAKAGLTGVTAGNVSALNSALDSAAVSSPQLGTEALAQGVVDAYNAILGSADGAANTPATALPGDVYKLIGVTDLQAGGAPLAGSSLSLLDSVIDLKATTDVNTVAKVQALADEANRVMAAAGQISGTPALSGADLTALGITGLTANNTQAVINAIVAQTSDANVDTLAELQAVATLAETKAGTALAAIIAADSANTAENPALVLATYTDAGVSFAPPAGVTTATLLGAVNSALDTGVVGSPHVSSTATVQSVVSNYSAILGLANGTADTPAPVVTGNQYADVGVTGVSGATAPVAGTNVFLLDSAVDAKAATAVDTVPELQAIANAATDVIAAANHGTTNVTGAELLALGVTGDFSIQATVDAINLAIHNAAATAVDTQAELQGIANLAAHAVLSSTLSNVTNLDVTSNLVFTSTSAVQLGATGHIRITETGGVGYGLEAVAGNSQDIDLSTVEGRAMVSIDATGTKITINPGWDLDLGANYSLSVDAGSFVSTDAAHLTANGVTGMTFSTVTPGTHTGGNLAIASDAHASQAMDSTGALVASKSWLDMGGLSNSTSTAVLLGSLDTGSYALVLENYATTQSNAVQQYNGIKAHDTNVSVTNFGADDLIYFDAQANNASTQRFDASLTNLINGNGHGGVAGQTAMEIGLVSSPTQNGSSAQILMGFLGNTTNQIFPAVYTSADGEDLGFGTFLHSTPVIMG